MAINSLHQSFHSITHSYSFNHSFNRMPLPSWLSWAFSDQVFSPDGKALLTSSVEGFARLFDVETGGCLVTFGRKTTGGALATSLQGNCKANRKFKLHEMTRLWNGVCRVGPGIVQLLVAINHHESSGWKLWWLEVCMPSENAIVVSDSPAVCRVTCRLHVLPPSPFCTPLWVRKKCGDVRCFFFTRCNKSACKHVRWFCWSVRPQLRRADLLLWYLEA